MESFELLLSTTSGSRLYNYSDTGMPEEQGTDFSVVTRLCD
jgi:hypothetical protein